MECQVSLLNHVEYKFCLGSAMEPEIGEYAYYPPQWLELKAVVRYGLYRIYRVKNRFRAGEAPDELCPTKLTQRPPIIIIQEWS